ncbi:hypothetical protein [Rhizobium sp. Nf11,1]
MRLLEAFQSEGGDVIGFEEIVETRRPRREDLQPLAYRRQPQHEPP